MTAVITTGKKRRKFEDSKPELEPLSPSSYGLFLSSSLLLPPEPSQRHIFSCEYMLFSPQPCPRSQFKPQDLEEKGVLTRLDSQGCPFISRED